jgi:hypothetical protein
MYLRCSPENIVLRITHKYCIEKYKCRKNNKTSQDIILITLYVRTEITSTDCLYNDIPFVYRVVSYFTIPNTNLMGAVMIVW